MTSGKIKRADDVEEDLAMGERRCRGTLSSGQYMMKHYTINSFN